MGQVLHGSATTTEAIRRAIQHSQASLRALAKRYGINQKTVAKWKKRASVADLPTGPKEPTSTVLSAEEEAIIVAFRRHTLLPLDDCLYALQATIPHLTRSSLHRCLQRHGISRLPEVEGDKRAEEEVQVLSDRLLPHRHRRGPDRRRKALSVCRDRSDEQIRLRATGGEGQPGDGLSLPRRPDRSRSLQDPYDPDRQRHPIPLPAALRRRSHGPLHHPHVRDALPREWHRASLHQDQPSLDQRAGRANEPDDQGRDRQTLSLRQPRPARSSPRRLRLSLQFRPAPEDPQRPHALRVHLQALDFRARTIHPRSNPPNAGTKHGIFWVLRSGAPWADLPERYGPPTTIYNRFNRWRKAGVWDRLMDAITAAYDGDVQMIDTSIVRVHQQGPPAKRGIEIVASVAPEEDSPPNSTRWSMNTGVPSSSS